MKLKEVNLLIIFLFMVTSLLVTFFVAQPIQAESDLAIEYFNKTYLLHENKTTADSVNISNNFGIIDWLPGREFEILLNPIQNQQFIKNIPLDNTPDYIIANLYKQIEILQQPTEEELEQKILASVVQHNLPIAVLNVWRPHTVIKIKNLSQEIWFKDNVLLASTDFEGSLSFFRDPTWQTASQITNMTESEVGPEETATFEFLIDGRGRPRVYRHVYKILISGDAIHMNAKGALYWLTRVDPYLEL